MIKKVIQYLFVFAGITCISYSKSEIEKDKAKKISYKDLLKESDSWKYNRIERSESTGIGNFFLSLNIIYLLK